MSKEAYDLVQIELEKRGRRKNYKPTASCFSGVIYCGSCGGLFGSKVWHSNTKYRRTIWQCNSKFKNENKCCTKHLTEPVLKLAFVTVFNEMLDNKDEIIQTISDTIKDLMDTTEIDKKIAVQTIDCKRADEKVKEYIYFASRTAIAPDEYDKNFNELVAVCDTENDKRLYLEQERARQLNCKREIEIYLGRLKGLKNICEFDEEMFNAVVEKIVVYKEKLVFTFRDGTEREYVL